MNNSFADILIAELLHGKLTGMVTASQIRAVVDKYIIPTESITVTVANSKAFADRRNTSIRMNILSIPPARLLFLDIIMKLKQTHLKLSCNDKHIDEGERYIQQMIDSGLRIQAHTSTNIAKGRSNMYVEYLGFEGLLGLLNALIEGTG